MSFKTGSSKGRSTTNQHSETDTLGRSSLILISLYVKYNKRNQLGNFSIHFLFCYLQSGDKRPWVGGTKNPTPPPPASLPKHDIRRQQNIRREPPQPRHVQALTLIRVTRDSRAGHPCLSWFKKKKSHLEGIHRFVSEQAKIFVYTQIF